MQRRFLTGFIVCILFVAIGVPVFAQDSTPAADANATAAANLPAWVCPPGFDGQTLKLFTWGTYYAEDTLPNFEKACGVTVDAVEFGSLEDMLNVIKVGRERYDIIVPTGYYIPLMAGLNLLKPIDLSKIPNFANVGDEFKNPTYDPGNKYSVPYQAGTFGIAYNKEKVTTPMTSWQDVWDYNGPVEWINDPRLMIGIALKELGFSPNTADPDEINQARDYLIAHGKNVTRVHDDDGQIDLQRGSADIVLEYSGDIYQIMADVGGDKFEYTIPKEGAEFWVDNLAIPYNAPNPELAQAYMDYILDPKVGADISTAKSYISPNQKARDLGLLDPKQTSNPMLYPDANEMKNLWLLEEDPDGVQLINEAWNEVYVALSQ